MANANSALAPSHSFFQSILNGLFNREPEQATDPALDKRTLRAIEHLPPYLLKDIGVVDF